MPGLSDERRFRSVRPRPIRSNNSVRRTYDLLRPQLPALGPDALLSERDLVNTFSASRGTVRHVLQLLAEEGVVTRGPKVGTTVHASTVIPVSELTPLDQWGSRGPVTGRLLESKVIPAFPAVRHRLQLPEESSVAMSEWLLIDDNTPLALFVSYLALSPEQASLLRAASGSGATGSSSWCRTRSSWWSRRGACRRCRGSGRRSTGSCNWPGRVPERKGMRAGGPGDRRASGAYGACFFPLRRRTLKSWCAGVQRQQHRLE